jgi:hypothetical protein
MPILQVRGRSTRKCQHSSFFSPSLSVFLRQEDYPRVNVWVLSQTIPLGHRSVGNHVARTGQAAMQPSKEWTLFKIGGPKEKRRSEIPAEIKVRVGLSLAKKPHSHASLAWSWQKVLRRNSWSADCGLSDVLDLLLSQNHNAHS